MLQAVLRRKLTRPEEGMEDLLTSNTFGLMKYLPLEAALLPFLGSAVNPHTGAKLDELLERMTQVDRWEFWPYIAHPDCIPCEPDVEIVFSDGGRTRLALAVEAKYRSGKSSFASEAKDRPNDQLAREYDNMTFMAPAYGAARCGVVYITTDPVCPVEEIRQSAEEYRAKRGVDPAIYWTSWRFLPAILGSSALQTSEIASDLRSLLLAMELTTFCRLRFSEVMRPSWVFRRTETIWRRSVPAVAWRFDRACQSGNARSDGTSKDPDTRPQGQFRWELSQRPDALYRWRKP